MNNFDRVRIEEDVVVSTVEARVHGIVLAAMENVVISRAELVIKSANASSERGSKGVV